MIPLSDSQHKTHRFPFWTLAIIILNIYVFYLELSAPFFESFISQYALIPSQINFSIPETLYPFITSQFLHGGFLHIISNMWFLWVFGDNVEERLGFLLFPFFYIISGIVAGLSQYLLFPQSDIPMIGASGAVAGVLGAYLALFAHHTIKSLVPAFGFFTVINVPASLMLIWWFITQIFSGSVSLSPEASELGGIAYFAHIGGFATGWLLAIPFKLSRPLHQID